MKRNWLVLLGATVFLAILAGCSNGGSSTTEDGKKIIKVALSDEVNPPFYTQMMKTTRLATTWTI